MPTDCRAATCPAKIDKMVIVRMPHRFDRLRARVGGCGNEACNAIANSMARRALQLKPPEVNLAFRGFAEPPCVGAVGAAGRATPLWLSPSRPGSHRAEP